MASTSASAQIASAVKATLNGYELPQISEEPTGELMEMRQLLRNPKYSDLWGKSYTKELGCLAQGIPGTKGTDTIVFIKYDKIPLD
jgi:hypothetical protein